MGSSPGDARSALETTVRSITGETYLLETPMAERKDAPAPTEWIALDTSISKNDMIDSRQTPFPHGSRDSRLGAHAPILSHNGVK
jgi:hypothetical protein